MATNVVCKLKDGETSDKLIKRFFKKCKKQEIIREYCEKVEFFRTKSQKKRDKRRRNAFIRRKQQESLVKL